MVFVSLLVAPYLFSRNKHCVGLKPPPGEGLKLDISGLKYIQRSCLVLISSEDNTFVVRPIRIDIRDDGEWRRWLK